MDKLDQIGSGFSPIKSHKTTIFPWFSHGFPHQIPWRTQRRNHQVSEVDVLASQWKLLPSASPCGAPCGAATATSWASSSLESKGTVQMFLGENGGAKTEGRKSLTSWVIPNKALPCWPQVSVGEYLVVETDIFESFSWSDSNIAWLLSKFSVSSICLRWYDCTTPRTITRMVRTSQITSPNGMMVPTEWLNHSPGNIGFITDTTTAMDMPPLKPVMATQSYALTVPQLEVQRMKFAYSTGSTDQFFPPFWSSRW